MRGERFSSKSLQDWNKYAKGEGYKSIKDMINYLYWEKKKSSRVLAKEMGITCSRLLQMMEDYGIKRRSRGGPNR